MRHRPRHWRPDCPETTISSAVFGHAVGTDSGDQLREAVGAGNEVAVGVGPEQRHAADVGVGELDAQNVCRLGLDLAPVGHAAVGPLDELAGRNRAVGGEDILAQKHLMRGMRGVGLVLVDERRRRVDRPDIIGRAHDAIVPCRNRGPCQHHEVGVAALDIERIVRLQRNEHGAAAALVDEVEAVIEELAEQREPRVERRRQSFVRRNVGKVDVVAVHRDAVGLEGGIAHDHEPLPTAVTVSAWAAVALAKASSAACSAALGGVRGSPSPSWSAAVLAFCITTRAWYSASKAGLKASVDRRDERPDRPSGSRSRRAPGRSGPRPGSPASGPRAGWKSCAGWNRIRGNWDCSTDCSWALSASPEPGPGPSGSKSVPSAGL